jgi:hypothetical protein
MANRSPEEYGYEWNPETERYEMRNSWTGEWEKWGTYTPYEEYDQQYDPPGQDINVEWGTGDGSGGGGAVAGDYRDWLQGGEDRWLQFIDPTRQALEGYLSGVNPAAESAIAYGNQAATRNRAGNLALRGQARGGAGALLGQAQANRATSQLAQSRLGTQQMGIAGALGQSGQYAGLLRGQFGPYGSLLQSMHGTPTMTGMWSSLDREAQMQGMQEQQLDIGKKQWEKEMWGY